MPPPPPIPSDDLYRRLGVPSDASAEAIELAWRGLLRVHHPDVAGPDTLELAKRINVAHDWLSDPSLRARYDRERGLRHAVGPRGQARAGVWHPRDTGRSRAGTGARRARDVGTAEDRFIARIAALTPTELDRLALAQPPPIAFPATIRRFLPPERLVALEALEARVEAALPPGADRPAIRDAIDGYATELVLGPFLDELLTEPFRGRTHERLTRGWDAAVGQPRFGPNGAAVERLIGRIAALDPGGVRALAATGRSFPAETPWPPGVSVEDEDALRVSAVLAARDAAAAVPGGVDAASRSQARRAATRPAHLLALRHAFARDAYAALTSAWRPWLLEPDATTDPVRRPVRRS